MAQTNTSGTDLQHDDKPDVESLLESLPGIALFFLFFFF